MATVVPAGRQRLLRNGDYVRLMSGQTLSSLGSAMSSFVFPIFALVITGSPVQAGLVGTASALGGTIASLPAGALADRWSRRRVLLGSSAAGAVLYGSVAVAGVIAHVTLVQLVLVAFGSGVCRAFFLPAQNAALRQIVDQADLGTAMAANEGRLHLSALLGGPLGGALFAVARVLPIGLDAVSYGALTMLIATIRTPLPAPAQRTREPLRAAIGAGLRWLVHQRDIRGIAIAATLLNFSSAGILLILILNLQRHGISTAEIGLLETAAGAGGLTGALIAPVIMRKLATGQIAILTVWIIAAALTATALTSTPAILMPLVTIALLPVPALNAGIFGYQTIITPDAMQGRAQSAISFLATSTGPLAPTLGGFLLGALGARPAVLILAIFLVGGALILTLTPSIRAIPHLSQIRAPEPEASPVSE